jgi:hypothetical protein
MDGLKADQFAVAEVWVTLLKEIAPGAKQLGTAQWYVSPSIGRFVLTKGIEAVLTVPGTALAHVVVVVTFLKSVLENPLRPI